MVGWINLRAFTVHGSSFKVVGSLRKIGWLDSLEKYIYIYIFCDNQFCGSLYDIETRG